MNVTTKWIAASIEWDTDGARIDELPSEVNIPDEVAEEDVADYLSDRYGFCVKSFALMPQECLAAFKKREEYMAAGHPAPWAIFPADEEFLEKAEKDEVLTERFEQMLLEEILSDEDRKAVRLISMYRNAPENYRMMIDAVLVDLCGWSMPTMLERAAKKR